MTEARGWVPTEPDGGVPPVTRVPEPSPRKMSLLPPDKDLHWGAQGGKGGQPQQRPPEPRWVTIVICSLFLAAILAVGVVAFRPNTPGPHRSPIRVC